MITKIAKVLAVVVCVLSLGFMGFAVAIYSGGKNWAGEIEAPDLAKQYIFENSGGENPTWGITRSYSLVVEDGKRAMKTSLGSEAGLPQAITKARKDFAAEQDKEIRRLNEGIAAATGQLEAIKKFQQMDIAALKTRIAELTQQADASEQQVKGKAAELTRLMDSASKTRKEAARRREDVGRLQNQLEVLRTDAYRLTELRRTLTDRAVQLKIANESLRQRRTQLTSQ